MMGSNKLIPDKNSLAVVNPVVAEDWDYDKNYPLTPYDVAGCSDRKVWWICKPFGHSWRASVGSRGKRKHGCPYCSGQRVLKGFNDLLTINPALAGEWDDLKNGTLKPDMVTAGSSKKVYWKDQCGHSWLDTIVKRNSYKRGCPYCSNQRLLAGYNDLATTHPELASEWDEEKNVPLTPQDVMAGTEKKVWWKGKCGHGWKAYIYARKAGADCPYCANQRVLKGFNDLESIFPDIAATWNHKKNGAILPSMITPGANKKYWWTCSKGHEWEALVSSRTAGKGCPYCNGKRVIIGETDVAHVAPHLLAEWDYEKNGNINPEKIACKSKNKAWWRCDKGHEWKASIANRANGTGCPYCNGRKVLKGFNDLATKNPEIASQWVYEKNDGRSPDQISSYDQSYAWFRCDKGHEWKVRISSRTKENTGCPYCSGKKAIVGVNDFQTLHPDLMCQWNYEKNKRIDPSRITEGSKRPVWWKCSEGHEWQARIYYRTKGTGCPHCARMKNRHAVYPGYNDLETLLPRLAEDWDYQLNGELRPSQILPSSNRTVWWKCKQGHNWRASPNQRSGGKGCPYCDGKTPPKKRLV